MSQAHIYVLNSFYLRFSSIVLHFYGSIPSLSAKFLPTKVLLSSCSNLVSYRVTLNQQSVNCDWCVNSCQHYITQWLYELQFKHSSHLLLQWGPANPACIKFSSHLCWLNTSQQIQKITILQEWHSHLVCIENHYIIFSTVTTKTCQLQLLLFSLSSDRTLINIKIISHISHV